MGASFCIHRIRDSDPHRNNDASAGILSGRDDRLYDDPSMEDVFVPYITASAAGRWGVMEESATGPRDVFGAAADGESDGGVERNRMEPLRRRT